MRWAPSNTTWKSKRTSPLNEEETACGLQRKKGNGRHRTQRRNQIDHHYRTMKKQRVALNVRKEMDAIEHNVGIKAIFDIERGICPVSWGCRIHWLHFCREVRPPKCPGYNTKQSDGEVPAVLELWEKRSTPSLPLLSGPLWPGVVAPDKSPIYGLNRTNSILMLKWIVLSKLNILK